MFKTHTCQLRRSTRVRWRLAPAISSMIAVVIWSGLAYPVSAGDRAAAPPYDRRALSEVVRDVLRGGDPNRSVAEPSLPGGGSAPALEHEGAVSEREPDEATPATHIAPPRRGIIVPLEPGTRTPKVVSPETVAPAGYHSNSWRQGTDTGRGLSFSSGRLAPATGLDPALAADTHGLRSSGGRQYVYGFLLLRVPADETLEKKLAGLDVELLGPHDDHHKARLPVASLQAIAALPEVEWVGVSSREQKQSVELAALRGLRGAAAAVAPGDSIPIVVNLFDGDDNGNFRRQLEAAGATLGRYDADLRSYRAVATGPVIDTIIGFDFVLFVELIGLARPTLDESTPLIDADLIRPGSTTYGIPRFGGYSIPVGIMDSGFRMGVNGHDDLYFKEGCARNFTDDGTSAFNDQLGHGTHVLGIIAGTGSANSRYRGMAPSVGLLGGGGIRAAKVFKKDDNAPGGAAGNINWTMAAMDWMTQAQDECGFPMPWVVNYSGGGHGDFLTGTDDESRRLDLHVFNHRQLYVVAADNRGKDGAGTVGRPGVAKNALTVGSVLDFGDQTLGVSPGDISFTSSRGPTGDGRMKPNVVAPGHTITSAWASDLDGYRTEAPGTSFAAPHVTGLAATLMEHYPFELDPAMLRAHLMATAIAHDNVTGKSNDYGLGRVSGWVAHWDHTNNDGWSNFWFSGLISTVGGYHYRDLIVPPGTKRLSIVMTWDELPASAGASRAVMWDLDLWADQIGGCSGPCAQYRSVSKVDNVEYIVVNNPPAGTYRLRAFPISAPLAGIPFGVAATVIRGNTNAEMTAYIEAPSTAALGAPFPMTVRVGNHSYVASAVRAEVISQPSGVTPIDIVTTRLDGVNMRFTAALGGMTLGNLPPETSRYATWYFRPTTPGPKTFLMRASSENGGEIILTKTVQVDSVTNLVQTAMGTSPSAPLLTPGGSFSVTDTVQNSGLSPSGSSTTRYYLSLDATKSADDVLLSGGTHSVPGLEAGASHTATVNVTVPAATALNSYFLLVCADDKAAVAESNEADNCVASPGAIVTVGRPDLTATELTTNPPAPARTPGTTFSVSDTVQNVGPVGAGSSATRYYLSLDAVKSAGDILLTGSRGVPALGPGTSNSGSITVTIPGPTPLGTYFLLACADNGNTVAETTEANNCIATPGAIVTVGRPDLVESAVSNPPATKARGGKFQVTDTVQNVGAAASNGSTTRYYLSLDAVKGAGDTALTGSRSVPTMAAGGSHSGTVTLTIPSATPLNTYFLLACADNGNTVVETDEANNCKASSTMVTITP